MTTQSEETMSDFVKKVVNSVAVQTSVFAITEGGKVAWPKIKRAFRKMMDKADSVVNTQKVASEFSETIENTKRDLEERVRQQKKAPVVVSPPPAAAPPAATPTPPPAAAPPKPTPKSTPNETSSVFDAKFNS